MGGKPFLTGKASIFCDLNPLISHFVTTFLLCCSSTVAQRQAGSWAPPEEWESCSSCSAGISQSNEPLFGTNPNVDQRAYSPVLRARTTYCSALKITWGKQGNSELGKRMVIY